MYARINENGRLEIFRKRYIVIDDVLTVNPSEAVMRRAGYKPLVMAAEPQVKAGEALSVDYVDTGERIEGIYTVIGGGK